MNKITGKRIEGDAHIAQSIVDILTTPLGSRVMLRDYGSRLFELVDAPVSRRFPGLLVAATATPLRKWEPRINLTKVEFSLPEEARRPSITIIGTRTDLPGDPPFSLSIPL